MSRGVCLSLLVGCLAASPVSAQDAPQPSSLPPATVESPRPVAANATAAPQLTVGAPQLRAAAPKRPAALVPMYASLAALQGLDFVSTTRALSNGAGYEANPVMRPIVGNTAGFLAVKASSTAATIWMTERLRRKHPVRAVVVMVSTNAAMAAVVAHNFSVR
jgi:uncharacterized protein DUF5658